VSRIYEALQRAEQERASGMVKETVLDVTEPVVPTVTHAGSAVRSVEPHSPSALQDNQVSSRALRFEDLRERCSKPSWKLDPTRNVFGDANHPVTGAEPFRRLRSRLYQFRENRPLRTLLVTSALPTEGKTYVASNLAQAFVRQNGRCALLIDADLHCPQLHVPFGAASCPGLSDYLRGEATEISIIQQGAKEDLFFIPAGNPGSHPTELIGNGRLKVLLERMTPLFDWIILDSPPTLPVTDASLLARLCDGVLLIVRAAHTPHEAAQKACMEFREQNLVGIVLNRAEEGAAHSGYSYYS
jgi:protein-tyrosine kinase